MTAQTPGQAAYEAFRKAFPGEDWGPWDSPNVSDIESRDGWKSVAHAAIAAQEPQPAPLPHGIALAALECIRQAYEPGTMAHDTAHKALDDTAAARAANAAVDVNDLLVTPAAAALYGLCSAWEREALRIPRMLGEKDPRAQALQDCAAALRDDVNGLRRDGEL